MITGSIKEIQSILDTTHLGVACFFELDNEPKESKLIHDHFTKLGYKVTLDIGEWALTTIQK